MKQAIQKKYLEYLTAGLAGILLILLYLKDQYGWGVMCLVILLILAKLDTLKSLTMSIKDGIKAEFDQKTLENIRENKDPITTDTYLSYRDIESRVINSIIGKYGSGAEIIRDYRIGKRYRVDLYIKSSKGDELYEIKFVRSASLVHRVVDTGVSQLKEYAKSVSGKPNLHLILASQKKLNLKDLNIPNDVSIEQFQLD